MISTLRDIIADPSKAGDECFCLPCFTLNLLASPGSCWLSALFGHWRHNLPELRGTPASAVNSVTSTQRISQPIVCAG